MSEITWYSHAAATPLCYAIGREIILQTRERMGVPDKIKLKEFHDLLLSQGSIALPLVIQTVFGEAVWQAVHDEIFSALESSMTQFERPQRTAGMRHLALNVSNLAKSVDFYTRLLGMEIEWQPDEDNYYLTSGNDNLALHRAQKHIEKSCCAVAGSLGFYY